MPRSRTALSRFRAQGGPIGGVALFFFLETAFAPVMAWAAPRENVEPAARVSTTGQELPAEPGLAKRGVADEGQLQPALVEAGAAAHAVEHSSLNPASARGLFATAAQTVATEEAQAKRDAALSAKAGAAASKIEGTRAPVLDQSLSLPTGGDKTGVTGKAISLPQGSGKIQGMGESFSAQLSTGVASFSVPFSLLPARGAAEPSLGLSYSSSSGFGLAGVGWDVSVPFIARQTDRGLPGYDDRPSFHPNQDRFVFNGGQELIPICVVDAGACAGAPNEAMPAWAQGSQYFRPRVEGSFLRFFWSPDHRTWRVQDKSGVTMELGVPLDGSNDSSALEVNPESPAQIYRWHLVRQYDMRGSTNPSTPLASPTPNNVIIYRYSQSDGLAYLSDIFDTTPVGTPTATDTSLFAHHTRLIYEQRSDPTTSYRSGWRIAQTQRLVGVDVTSKTFNDAVAAARHQVRRYHLAYQPGHISLLASVQMEGRCTATEASAPAELSGSFALPGTTGCDALPPMTFDYSHVTQNADLPGFEGFDENLHTIQASPPHSVDEQLTDLLDVNSDGLVDVVNTSVGTYGYGHGVFFNSPAGVADSFGNATLMTVQGVLGANANTITFANLNLSSLDLDGDGTIDLLHMPQEKTYSMYTPAFSNGGWSWLGRAVATASGQSPKIDFGKDTTNTKVVDVNGDGLVDVLVSTGTEYQTFFSLGRFPQGDGQFGSGSWSTPSTGALSNDPVRTCVPDDSAPAQLSDPDIQLADMNGDGLPDIVRLRRGDIRYWPGRGNGVWGTGSLTDCLPGTFSSNSYVKMGSSPTYSDIQGTTLRVDDVNGDGLDDLVQVRFDAVDIWLNVDGQGWTDRHSIANTPKSPSYASRVRLVDVNGSGTRDILWANGGSYQYIDLEGGNKSWLLTHVDNGIGKTTSIEYSTSTKEMLAAESSRKCDPTLPADAQLLANSPWSCAWTTKMPTVAHVVKRVTDSDNLVVAGQSPGQYLTEYQYRDPVFEGRQREFRGFARARVKHVGDANSPSDYTETAFLLGECEDETPADGIDECAVSERWRDNPREALKGLPSFTEKYDEKGVFLSTDSSIYRLRQLYVGLDGRAVRHAFESSKTNVLYDTALGPQSAAAPQTVTTVELETSPPAAGWDPIANQRLHPGQPATGEVLSPARQALIPRRASSGVAVVNTLSELDFAGNRLVVLDFGCQSGDACVSAGVGLVADETIAHVTKVSLVDGGTSGWLWRPTESWVTGSVHQDARDHMFVAYDSYGSATSTTADLHGVVALDRFTAVPANGTAPLPLTRSADNSVITVSTDVYNAFGLLTQEQGALSHCRDVSFASDPYGMLVTGETIHTSGGCASTGLAALGTSAMYDRGLMAVTTAIDLQLQVTQVQYDSLGRLSALFRPAPDLDGMPASVASMLVSYALPSAANPVKYSVIHTQIQDGSSYTDASSYLDSYLYIDGFGRNRVEIAEADKSANDAGAYVVSDLQNFDAKGGLSRKYLAYFTDEVPTQFPLAAAPSAPFGRQRYDAFARHVEAFDLDSTLTIRTSYHALSSDISDAADLEDGPHQGTFASTRSDGHGRTIVTTERARTAGALESRDVRTEYLPTGQPEVITRVRVNAVDAPVVRWMRYDSLGHLVLNVDPNTSKNFNPNPGTDPTPATNGLKAWRYAFDDAGELVGTSDARGCGENFTYDAAGRILTEDYSPCGVSGQPAFTSGALSSPPNGPVGYEVIYWYDSAPQYPFPETTKIFRPTNYATAVNSSGASSYLRGRLVTVWSRGRAEWRSYDGRGRVIQSAVLPALPVDPVTRVSPNVVSQRYGQRFYTRDFKFDAADREISATTGSVVAQLQGVANATLPSGAATSAVVTDYSKRGTVKSVRSTYGDLVTSITRSADGLVQEVVYGDVAGTRTDSDYDARRRLRDLETFRGVPSIWSTAPTNYTPLPSPNGTPTSFQLVLQDQALSYDVVGNPTEIRDYRTPQEWPAGSKPVTQKIQYDDLYRATRIDYETGGGSDAWTSPFAAELAGLLDTRRAAPAPQIKFDTRPLYQTFSYDWLGNTMSSDDDVHAFYDRSLGAITNASASGHPYQLAAADNKSGPATARSGSVVVRYDDMGNVNRINLERNGVCLPSGSSCSARIDMQYDEVGRLNRVFRLDLPAASLPPIATDTTAHSTRDLQFLYDENDERVVKTSSDVNNLESTTLYPHDTLEVRGTKLDSAVVGYNETQLTADNEVPYLRAHGMRLGRVHFEQPSKGEPRVGTSNPGLHVLLELEDHLGSTNIVIDKATSELVEASTYEGYGAKETDYRPDRWKGYRDDYGFTDKEEDVELGVVYFGKRFYSPYLNRWITPDPLAVHSPGKADYNLYAYVSGEVMKDVDSVGLDSTDTVKAGGKAKNGDVTVSVDIVVYDRDPVKAQQMAVTTDQGLDVWRKTALTAQDSSGDQYNVHFVGKVTVAAKKPAGAKGGQNLVTIGDYKAAGCTRTCVSSGNHAHVENGDVNDADVMAHEIGHFIHLKDRYHDAGKSTAPNKGWSGNIMAELPTATSPVQTDSRNVEGATKQVLSSRAQELKKLDAQEKAMVRAAKPLKAYFLRMQADALRSGDSSFTHVSKGDPKH